MNEKIASFLTAILNVYRSEENQEPINQIEIGETITEDFTALIIAMKIVFGKTTGENDIDLIDFTHLINKLAVQYLLEKDEVKQNDRA